MKSNEDKLKRFGELSEELSSLFQEIFQDLAEEVERLEKKEYLLNELCDYYGFDNLFPYDDLDAIEKSFKKHLDETTITRMDNLMLQKKLEPLKVLKPRIKLKESTIINDGKEYEVVFIDASGFVFKNSEEHRTLGKWLDENK